VVAGIDVMLRYNIFITEDSVDLIKEKNNYKWKENSSGDVTNVPVDAWNHGFDASRYACFSELNDGIGKFTKNHIPPKIKNESKTLNW